MQEHSGMTQRWRQMLKQPTFMGLTIDETTASTHILDAILMGATMIRVLPFLPGGVGGIPLGEIAGSFLALIALNRRPTRRLERLAMPMILCIVLLGWLISISLLTGVEWIPRAMRITLIGVLAFEFASGQIDMRSALRGMFFGLLANAALFNAGIAPHPYGSALTGYLDDKNRAALITVLVGVLFMSYCRQRRQIWMVLLLTGAMLWETESRTTLTAFGAALAWIFLRPRLTHAFARVSAIGIGYLIIDWIQENFSQAGNFSDRAGSDQLRERIDAASQLKLEHTPWHGSGLGTAWVTIDDHKWFFHNSYWATLEEGGWIALALVLFLVVIYGLRLDRAHITTLRQASTEAVIIAVFVCSWRLGEVFFALSSAIVLGAILTEYLISLPDTDILSDDDRALSAYRLQAARP